jgi:cation diffusion facilitator family transporter
VTAFIRDKRRLIIISFSVGFALMLIKFTAYFITGSKAILTDALESIINVIASGFAFYSIYLSSQPKDSNHPYGHGKIEFFSAGFEGALIFFAGIYIIVQSIINLFSPNTITGLQEGMVLIGFTVIVNLLLGTYLKREGVKLNSITLIADGKHLLVDSFSSIILIIGIGIIYFTDYYWIDSILSILFSLLILYNGYKLIRASVSGLMDEVDPAIFSKIAAILTRNRRDSWIDVHNVKIQRYGADLHIDCHVTLPCYLDLNTVHEELNILEMGLSESFLNNVEVSTHADPCLPGPCCSYCRVKDCTLRKFSKEMDYVWDHDKLSRNQKHFV